MALVRFLVPVLFAVSCSAAFVRVNFEKCGTKGFTCINSLEFPSKADIYFTCSNITGQDIQLYLWQFNSPTTIASLTIQHCENVQISFTCTGENKPIQWLKIKNAKTIDIMQTTVTHNPPKIIFENISYIKTLASDTFVQIKKIFYKPGCLIPINDTDSIEFTNVKIGRIEPETFKNLTGMRNFAWNNVTVDRIAYNAINLDFLENGGAVFKNCNVGVVEPLAIQVTGDKLVVTESNIDVLWSSSINGTIYDFEFNNNTVDNLHSGAIAILAQSVYINNNFFRRIESGAFHKISPGLLHDSQRNFGTLMFTYNFNNNLIEHVEDGGIRPDIEAYRNVAAEVNYRQNTMQCSCEAISWLGAEIDLGYGFSVLRDFNTMVLDPINNNKCSFIPCMCFGIRSPQKKGLQAVQIF